MIDSIKNYFRKFGLYASFHLCVGAKAISDSFYGKPNKVIHYGSVNCDGNEQVLTNCLYVQYSLEHGKELNIHVEVAGVNCQGNLQLTHDNISITNSLATSVSKDLTTAKLQYASTMMTSTTSGSEVAIISIGIVALIFGVIALIIG